MAPRWDLINLQTIYPATGFEKKMTTSDQPPQSYKKFTQSILTH